MLAATVNGYFFDVYNQMYQTNYRTDRYFDNDCLKAINDYQRLKGISEEFRGMISHLVMRVINHRIDVHIKELNDHDMEIRRYYRKLDY